ncbi:hypothetical protein DY000_02010424 [Brassica cretica]|uniref:Uncharacterized protein n=1 Tax=Brassica cretica TaxID=69181 RepID=A0ABQ7CCB8_BRACR|nr:hypothetical protein DY000_02010424 [Brassica cretica]
MFTYRRSSRVPPIIVIILHHQHCNAPIPRCPTGLPKWGLWIRVYSFRQPYVSRYCPAHREMEREGMSNGLLSEVTLDQPARMTLYTTPCGNQG